jgi:small-conductance mechanosensitive channel
MTSSRARRVTRIEYGDAEPRLDPDNGECSHARRMSGWARIITVAMIVIASSTSLASAQPAPASSTLVAAPPAKIEEIRAADILARADEDEQFVRVVLQRIQTSTTVLAELDEALTRRAGEVQTLIERSQGNDLPALPMARLESMRRHWLLYDREVARARATLTRATQIASDDAAGLASRRSTWQMTRDADNGLAQPLLQRVDEVLGQLGAAQKALSDPLDQLIGLGRKSRALSLEVQSGLATVVEQIAQQDRRLLEVDAPPLWRAERPQGAADRPVFAVSPSLAIETAFGRDYDALNEQLMRVLVVASVLFLPLILWLRHRAALLLAANRVSSQSLHALSRPYAAWLVLVGLCAALYNLQGPTIRQQVVLLVAWLPVLRLMPSTVLARVGPWAYVSAGFYFLYAAMTVLIDHSLFYRSLLLGLDLIMLGALVWLLLRLQRAAAAGNKPAAEEQEIPDSVTYGVLLVGAVIVFVAVVSNVLGNVSLASMLSRALLNSGYAALVTYAAASVLATVMRVLLARKALAHLASRHTGSLLIKAVARAGRVAAVVAWVTITLGAFRMQRPLFAWVAAIFAHQFSLGVLSISLGSIAAFFLAAWGAFWLAKMVRLLLGEDILPTLSLPRGVANSISTLSYYSVVFVGLIAALGVAGYEIKQLAIVFGALGVGIGFGLQDIVKNFVSGLILMVERPIQPGDTVDVAGMYGRVREIGMRATIVTTLEGAQVIVPNGKLLAEQLVNWTLVSSRRRIDISIVTAFDVAPQRTLELLVSFAATVEGVAKEPPPSALLTGLTGGALEYNLRAWTTDKADWVAVRSALAVRVRDGLAEAGIVVPPPQWTLHMERNDRAALTGKKG